jgi:hypothetical protein
MTQPPKFEIGQHVYKWTGDYGGPGIVRGIAGLDNGKLRYLVGHKIEGGTGEFLHVYAEGNLRGIEALNDLLTVTKEEGLRSRTGQPTPEGATGTIGLQCPGAVGTPNNTELIEALATAHRQVDMLMAMVITLDNSFINSFMPSQSSLWPDIVERIELLRKYEATPGP